MSILEKNIYTKISLGVTVRKYKNLLLEWIKRNREKFKST